jgi:hypothetical protein
LQCFLECFHMGVLIWVLAAKHIAPKVPQEHSKRINKRTASGRKFLFIIYYSHYIIPKFSSLSPLEILHCILKPESGEYPHYYPHCLLCYLLQILASTYNAELSVKPRI